MRVEGGPNPNNAVSLENSAVAAARRFATEKISQFRNRVNTRFYEVHRELNGKDKIEFERRAMIFKQQLEANTAPIIKDFINNMSKAESEKDETKKIEDQTYLRNNLSSYILFEEKRLQKFLREWDEGEQEMAA
jgi:hypothetical protein